MLALSLMTLLVAAIALYVSSIINDDVFKTATRFTSVAFFLVTLICAPWILKLSLMTIPLAIARLNSVSAKNL